MNWIIAANIKKYDVLSAFNDNTYVDWRQNASIQVGDIVYIYVSRPYKRVMFKTVVIAVNLTLNETTQDKKYWVDQLTYDNSKVSKYMRLKLVQKIDNELLTLDKIIEYGMKGAPQRATKLKIETLSYIEQCILSPLAVNQKILSNQFEMDLVVSRNRIKEERLTRISVANKLPEKIQVVSTAFKRNPDVVVTVLERANGICERCDKPAPFKRASDSTPYLEVHHKIRLADGGEDTVENTIAVCPNCHRELHYGI